MENLKSIKNRIKTVGSIIKTTNAMKMVSTIKLARFNNINKFSKESSDILFDMLSNAAKEGIFEQVFPLDFWLNRKNGKTLILILTTDQGFCGNFTQSIIDTSTKLIDQNKDAYIHVFGKKSSIIKHKIAKIKTEKNAYSKINIKEFSESLSDLVFDYITNKDVYNVILVSGKFQNALIQKAKISKILPLNIGEISNSNYTKIEGNKNDLINDLLKVYLSKLFIGSITEHLISEFSARVMSMDNSVRNANEMSDKLNISYNRTRQSKITQELTEIISSMESVQ